jgi:2,3-diketo-5-methylthio-1-phosphopentane phosphatase
MQIASILDFDGTVVYEDVFERLLDEFTKEDWRYYDYLVEKGELSLEEAVSKQFDLIKHAGLNALFNASLKYLNIREGFYDFAKYCEDKSIELVIASAGLSFYIHHLINKNNFKVTCYCMNVIEKDGSLILYQPSYDKKRYKNFKQAIVNEYKGKGFFVIYIGDGFNDFWAAKDANLVFAVKDSVLEQKCKESNLTFKSFSSFNEVVKELSKLEY